MKDQRIFFLGSGHGGAAALRSLLAAFPLLEIVTKDRNLRALGREMDMVHKSIPAIDCEFGVMAGHNEFLDADFVSRKTILNVHYSLLPKYRGMHSVVWAMLNLEPEIGITVHVTSEGMDAGPIIHQYSVKYENQTSWELMQLFDEYVTRELGQVAVNFLEGKIKPQPQNDNEATWVPRRNSDDCLVDFLLPAKQLRAFFRALVRPYPLPAMIIGGQRYEISDATVAERPYFCDVGRVVNVDIQGSWVKCLDSLLIVRKLIDSHNIEREAQDLLPLGTRLFW